MHRMVLSAQIVKCIHVLCSTVFMGVTVASFFYIALSQKQHKPQLMRYALRSSFFGDGLLLALIIIVFTTASYLLPYFQLSTTTPWIRVAFAAFGIVSCLWLVNVVQKTVSYRCRRLVWPVLYYINNSVMILILLLIVHDAVMHRTWFA
ncbi:MAG: hypothetical protein COB66_09560 [Coxiella sp. (in: Bacteria)]|nr:MAG: hypothetical protein COB66_09560 [Coxiella sp. (in: g-proteobacteria)]